MNQDEEFKQQICANDAGEKAAEPVVIMKIFCPNCEKETECEHTAELYECNECGEDFAQYIVPRKPSNSDVSATEDVRQSYCNYIYRDGIWESSCGGAILHESSDKTFSYCPFCGKHIATDDLIDLEP